MNLGFSKSNLQYFFTLIHYLNLLWKKIDHAKPISHCTSLFSLSMFPPTAVEASLICTRVYEKLVWFVWI